MYYFKIGCIFCIASLLISNLFAQKKQIAFKSKILTGVGYSLEAGAFVSSGKSNPFWLRSNQYGEVPIENQVFSLRATATKDFDTQKRDSQNRKKLLYAYGARAVINVGRANQFLFSELYGKVRYGAFEFQVGRQKEIFGLVDSTLSIGSFVWSGNALPVPKIQISVPNYTPILKNGLIAVKGNFAHGWFGSGDSTLHYFLHQKSIYFRVGKPNWRFKFHGGMNHQVQWGGKPTVPFLQGGTNAFITKYGSGLDAFVHVATGISLNEGYYKDNDGISGEGGNRLGNHLGTIDLALEYENNKTKWMLYRQSIYEDGSLFLLSNISDGLLGLSIQRKGVKNGLKKITFEYLNTSNQGGSFQSGNAVANVINELRGADNYFNNSTYDDGWTYRRQTIGTPFLMPLNASTGIIASDIIGNFTPRYPINPYYILNNRVKVGAVSIESRVKALHLLTRFSYSQNMGIYYLYTRTLLSPVSINQVSFQQQCTFPYKQYQIGATLAYDSQGVLEENWGLNLLVKRKF